MRRSVLMSTLAAAGALAATAPSPAAPGAAQRPVAADTTPPEISIAFSSTQLESRLLKGGVRFGIASDESVTFDARLSLGGRSFGEGEVIASGSGAITGGPGKRLVTMPLTDRGKALIRRPGTELLVLHVTARDGAENRAVVADRISRTQSLAQRRGGSIPAVIFGERTIFGPGTRIPTDFPGYREPADGRLPDGYRIVRYGVRAARGDGARLTLFAPDGFRIVTLGVAEGSAVTPRVRSASYRGKRAVSVTLEVDPSRASNDVATGTIYLLARRAPA
jgi:hypothetical protein